MSSLKTTLVNVDLHKRVWKLKYTFSNTVLDFSILFLASTKKIQAHTYAHIWMHTVTHFL